MKIPYKKPEEYINEIVFRVNIFNGNFLIVILAYNPGINGVSDHIRSALHIIINTNIDIFTCNICNGYGFSKYKVYGEEANIYVCDFCKGKGYLNFIENFFGVRGR